MNTKKSVLDPAQIIEFLGLSVDSIAMEIRLPSIKNLSRSSQSSKTGNACLHNCWAR